MDNKEIEKPEASSGIKSEEVDSQEPTPPIPPTPKLLEDTPHPTSSNADVKNYETMSQTFNTLSTFQIKQQLYDKFEEDPNKCRFMSEAEGDEYVKNYIGNILPEMSNDAFAAVKRAICVYMPEIKTEEEKKMYLYVPEKYDAPMAPHPNKEVFCYSSLNEFPSSEKYGKSWRYVDCGDVPSLQRVGLYELSSNSIEKKEHFHPSSYISFDELCNNAKYQDEEWYTTLLKRNFRKSYSSTDVRGNIIMFPELATRENDMSFHFGDYVSADVGEYVKTEYEKRLKEQTTKTINQMIDDEINKRVESFIIAHTPEIKQKIEIIFSLLNIK